MDLPEIFLTYRDLEDDGGVVTDFRVRKRASKALRRRLSWRMTYLLNAMEKRVSGGGLSAPVDLSLKIGDPVASVVHRRRWRTHMNDEVQIWMRSLDLTITPDEVLDTYYEQIGADKAEVTDRQMVGYGLADIYGRSLADVEFKLTDGQRYSHSQLMRMTFTRRSFRHSD